MGKQHGEGKIVNSKGKSRKGRWEDGNRISWLEGGRSNRDKSSVNQGALSTENNNDSVVRGTSFTAGILGV